MSGVLFSLSSNEIFRLFDVLLSESRLTIVFEYCDQDLKKYFDSCNGDIDQNTVKVSNKSMYILDFDCLNIGRNFVIS